MEIVEAVKIALLFAIAYEGAWFLIRNKKKKEEPEKEDVRTTRRDVYGIYKNPLGDSYRKNSRHQYIPQRPNSKMIESSGDDEDGV